MAQKIVSMVKDVINEQAKQAGLDQTGLMIEDLSKKQSRDMEKVNEKLDEIDAKVRALQEAMKLEDVVVKTWFESEE
jgi:tetrahydromethanopterin S-methyltransferase subunit B